MKKKTFAFITMLATALVAFAQGSNNQSTLGSLVEAERNFSKTSVAKGMRDAFIMNLADDGTLFRPHAVEGKKWMTAQPPRLSDVVGTNACRMSVHDAAPGRVVVFSALDNLVKGAAGQAVQNMNLAAGLPEAMGLETGEAA